MAVEVAVVRSNSVIYDYPVERLVRSLNKRYSLTVLGWNREGLKKTADGYMAKLELFNLKAPIGKPTLVPYYPLFWFWVFIKLCMCRPKIVHSIDLETIIPSLLYKFLFRKKTIFSVFDRYAMVNIPTKYTMLYFLVNRLEDILSGKSDVLITVSEKLLLTFKRRPTNSRLIMNLPEEHLVNKIESRNHRFRLVTTGPIYDIRGYRNVANAIKDLGDVEFVFAGRVMDRELLTELLKQRNIKYEGLLLPFDSLSLEAHSDAMIVLYDLRVPINNYALPCKLFEAMMCGIPIITNLAPEMVNKIGYGIVVDYDNVEQIKLAITKLRDDPELCRRLGNKGREAFQKTYNWGMMEKDLYKIHDQLLGQKEIAKHLIKSAR